MSELAHFSLGMGVRARMLVISWVMACTLVMACTRVTDLHDDVAGAELARVVRGPAEDHLVDLAAGEHDANLFGGWRLEGTRWRSLGR